MIGFNPKRRSRFWAAVVKSAICFAVTGHAGTHAVSTTCLVDTRTSQVVSLAIGGPDSCAAGGVEAYLCYAYYADGTNADVSAVCDWWIEEPVPSGAEILGGKLTSGIPPSPTTVRLRAGYKRTGGYVVAPAFLVTIAQGLSARLSAVNVVNAGVGAWDVSVSATVAGASGATQFQWKLDGGVISPAGASLNSYRITGAARTASLAVQVTDGAGKSVTISQKVVLNKPPVVDERPTLPPPSDPINGHILDSNGEQLCLDPDKAPVGLIVLTHGLWSSGKEKWVQNLRSSIYTCLWLKNDSIMPNICIYDWGEMSSPTKSSDDESIRYTSWLARFRNSTPLGFLTSSSLRDIMAIHTVAVDQGRFLADWIQEQVITGNVSRTAPVHFIGHSAGGFVVSECVFRLKEKGIITGDIQYTTLDTPILLPSDRAWFTLSEMLGSSCRMERYDVANGLGGLVSLFDWPATGPGYYSRTIFNVFALNPHAYAYKWYEDTTHLGLPWADTDGFFYSPFLGNGFHGLTGATGSWSMMSVPSASPSILSTLPNVAVTDFATFGDVLMTDGVYRITEQANAGIFKTLALPIGVQTVGFRYRFAAPGDGDYLCVNWSTNAQPLFLGSDMGMSRSGWVDAEVSLAQFAGETDDLVFKLVSRGETNAVLEIDGVYLTQTDDADNDGLTNDEELALGTDPLNWDTDGDGLDDGYEIHTSLTSPLLPDSDGDGVRDAAELEAGTSPNDPASCFRIAAFQTVSDNRMILSWNGKAGKTYRVHRSGDLTQLGYETLATGITGKEPVTVFTNSIGGVSGAAAGFFWVEMEQ